MQQTVIKATTAAVVVKQEINAQAYDTVIISANLLAAAEEVDIYVDIDGLWLVALDALGNVAKLTATRYQWVLPGGQRYAVLKDATVGACAVVATLKQDGAP